MSQEKGGLHIIPSLSELSPLLWRKLLMLTRGNKEKLTIKSPHPHNNNSQLNNQTKSTSDSQIN
jgi:hypothetical protein